MLNPNQQSKARGVVVEEIHGGVDFERKLKYDFPNMGKHNIGDHLTYNKLEMITGNTDNKGRPFKAALGLISKPEKSLTDDEKNWYSNFIEAWYTKLDGEGPAPQVGFGGGNEDGGEEAWGEQ